MENIAWWNFWTRFFPIRVIVRYFCALTGWRKTCLLARFRSYWIANFWGRNWDENECLEALKYLLISSQTRKRGVVQITDRWSQKLSYKSCKSRANLLNFCLTNTTLKIPEFINCKIPERWYTNLSIETPVYSPVLCVSSHRYKWLRLCWSCNPSCHVIFYTGNYITS